MLCLTGTAMAPWQCNPGAMYGDACVGTVNYRDAWATYHRSGYITATVPSGCNTYCSPPPAATRAAWPLSMLDPHCLQTAQTAPFYLQFGTQTARISVIAHLGMWVRWFPKGVDRIMKNTEPICTFSNPLHQCINMSCMHGLCIAHATLYLCS